MKFTLKNRPDAFASPRKVDEWFEGFEKELRELQTISHFKDFIKEILGE